MTPETLRRKLQKKKKHKPYRKCPACGGRSECTMRAEPHPPRDMLMQRCRCGFKKELTWTGGGIR